MHAVPQGTKLGPILSLQTMALKSPLDKCVSLGRCGSGNLTIYENGYIKLNYLEPEKAIELAALFANEKKESRKRRKTKKPSNLYMKKKQKKKLKKTKMKTSTAIIPYKQWRLVIWCTGFIWGDEKKEVKGSLSFMCEEVRENVNFIRL